MNGWIKLHRKIIDSWIWNDNECYDKRSAWIDLLLLADYSGRKVIHNGEIIALNQGQLQVSIRGLSNRWKWSTNRVYRFLNMLENDGMIERERNTNETLITIVNYSFYQVSENTKETPTDTTKEGTKKAKTRNSFSCEFEKFWKIYPRKVDKGNAYKKYCARVNSGFSDEELYVAACNYAKECKENNTDIKYIKHASTFLSDTTPFVDYLNKGDDGNGNTRANKATKDEYASEFERLLL